MDDTEARTLRSGSAAPTVIADVSYSPVSTASSSSLQRASKDAPASKALMDARKAPIKNSGRQSCWKRRSKLEKGLLITIIILVCVLVVAVVMAAVIATVNSSSSPLCLSEHCVKTASRLLSAMDASVDPCDDFFEYACGTWNRIHIIPDDKSNYNTFRKLGDELHATLKLLLEEPTITDAPAAIQKVKHMYQSCLNTTLIDNRGTEPLTSLLNQLGGWPVLDVNWDESKFDLETTVAKLRLYGSRALVNVWVGVDDRNSDVHVIALDQSPLGMPSRDYFLKGRDEKALKSYEKYVVNVAVAMGASRERAETEIAQMIDFEIQLANITTPEEDRRDIESLYQKMTVADVTKNLSKDFQWLKYLQTIFSDVDIDILSSEQVVVFASSFLQQLGEIRLRTPTRTLANYVIWNMVMNRVSNLPEKFLDLRTDFNKAVHGVIQDEPRWTMCVRYVNDNFGMAVGRIFVERHFNERAKANAMVMIQQIRDAFSELLEEVPWMDEETRIVAREKAEAITEKIGYPEYIMNDTALNADYETVEVDPNKYFENVLSTLRVATKNNLKELRNPVDKTKWSTAPAVVNAFYSATKNQIMFPAGILQPPFYHENYPKYLQFSGIAIAVAHEITHGFDDEGRQYDKAGNLKEWWSPSVVQRFKEKAQCIIDQYSNYTVVEAGLNLNGRQTQGENIADNGGLKQAFRAYKRAVEQSGDAKEYLLPGLSLTREQLFYLNFAQIWCGTSRPQYSLQSVRIGRHSPGRFRVIGSVSNSMEFAKAYNCPLGSAMNPAHKCAVW